MPPSQDNELYLMLGEIKADLKTVMSNQTKQTEQLGGLGTRVSSIETKATLLSGGVALFFTVGIDIIKTKLGF